VLTSAFSHYDVLHLAFNMLALYFLGPMLEQVLGRLRFLAVYFVSAFTGQRGGDAAQQPEQPDPGCVGRDLRPDGRPGRGRVQGQGRPAPDPVLARPQPGVHVLQHRQHLLGGDTSGACSAVR
jgi:hypothetical protein